MSKEPIQEMKEAIAELRSTLGRRPAPTVTVRVPTTTTPTRASSTGTVPKAPAAPAPKQLARLSFPGQLEFDVPQPTVNVEPPVVNVLPPQPRPYVARITKRDEAGFIEEFRIDPA